MYRNRLFIGLIILALVILGSSTKTWSQQSGEASLGDSAIVRMPAPANLPAGTVLTADLSITGEATMTLTNIDTGQSNTISVPSTGGSINMEVDFDSLGLPPGLYRIEEAFSGTVVGNSPFISFDPLYLNAEFESWEANIYAGAKIILNATANGSGSISGDFTGDTGNLNPVPATIWGLPITLQKDIKGPNPGPADIVEFNLSFNAILTEETSLIQTSPPNPILGSIRNQTVDELQTATVALSVTDPDSSLDTLVYSASIGTVTNTIWEYTPPLNIVNPPDKERDIKVTIIVQDPDGNNSKKSFILTVKDFNPAPVVEAVGDKSVREGDTLTVSFKASDPEGETLTFGYSVSPPFPTGSGVTTNFNSATGFLNVSPDYDTIIHPERFEPFEVTAWATDARGEKW